MKAPTAGASRAARSPARPGVGTFGFSYNPDGALTTITRPNGVTSTNSYDTAGRLTGLTYANASGTTIAAYAYTLDADGNRIGGTAHEFVRGLAAGGRGRARGDHTLEPGCPQP